jgi:hypothetical protein
MMGRWNDPLKGVLANSQQYDERSHKSKSHAGVPYKMGDRVRSRDSIRRPVQEWQHCSADDGRLRMDKEGLGNDRSDANGVLIFIFLWFGVNTVNAIIETQRSLRSAVGLRL